MFETDHFVVDGEKVLLEGHAALISDKFPQESVVVDGAVVSLEKMIEMSWPSCYATYAFTKDLPMKSPERPNLIF